MTIRNLTQALAELEKVDAARLYDSLEPWQQRELLCIVRRLVNRTERQGQTVEGQVKR